MIHTIIPNKESRQTLYIKDVNIGEAFESKTNKCIWLKVSSEYFVRINEINSHQPTTFGVSDQNNEVSRIFKKVTITLEE